MILEHLEMTHRHVANGVEQLARQRGVITGLEQKGLDISEATVLPIALKKFSGSTSLIVIA